MKGPFVDKAGIDLVDGGGETIYGTNGDVFAPGGQGILTDAFGDVLFYHYCEFLLDPSSRACREGGCGLIF